MTRSVKPIPTWLPLKACVPMPAEASPREWATWRNRFYSTIFFVLAVVHTLLPIERGLPVIQLAEGYPITMAMAASCVCFSCLVIESGGAIFQSYNNLKGYLQWQFLFVATLVLAAITSPVPKSAFFVVLNYFVCFILNFFTLGYLFMRGNRKTLLVIVCVVASAAAAIGLVERLFDYYLPFYRDCFLNFDYTQMMFAMNRTGKAFRALGPLGSPILQGVVLSLALSFALGLKSSFKWVTTMLLFISVLLSTSLTGALMVGLYVMGMLAGLIRGVRVLTLISISLVGIGGVMVIASGMVVDSTSAFQRAIYGDEANIQVRLQMIDLGFSNLLNFDNDSVLLTGRGLKSSGELVATGGNYSNTFDNVWLTIAYEAGIPAVFVFSLLQISVLHQLRRFIWTVQWWGILAWCAAGASFVTIYYATANFLWVALVAWLWTIEPRFPLRRVYGSRIACQSIHSPMPICFSHICKLPS